jgi:hypothetical protein
VTQTFYFRRFWDFTNSTVAYVDKRAAEIGISRSEFFEQLARADYNLAQEVIDYESKGMNSSARQKWKEIYEAAYPS